MKKKEVSKKNILFIVLEIIFVVIFIYAAVQLYMIFSDYKTASDEYSSLAESVVVESQEKVLIEETIKEEAKEESVLDLPYDYEVPDYEVDLAAVKAQNPDTVGWIILPDSKINYPIVKSKDNTEYLTTTFEGKTANSGAIFLDMYCPSDFNCDNAIVYGHNMKNGSMFRALNNMTDKRYETKRGQGEIKTLLKQNVKKFLSFQKFHILLNLINIIIYNISSETALPSFLARLF